MKLSCQRAAELFSESELRPLTRSERFSLALHRRLCRCGICKTFQDQMTELKRAYRQFSIRQARGEVDADPSLSEETKRKIQRAVQDRDV